MSLQMTDKHGCGKEKREEIVFTLSWLLTAESQTGATMSATSITSTTVKTYNGRLLSLS